MARGYRLSGIRRLANRMMAGLVRLGIGPRSNYLLTVVGRRTGKPMTTPVTPVENADGRWLVAPLWAGELGPQCSGGGARDAAPRPA